MSNLFVEQYGAGPDLVLLHGWGFNGKVWQGVLAELGEYFCLHLVDLPGFGHSDILDDYQLQALALQVAAVVPKQASWLGWSLGGLVATQAALLKQVEMSALITIASSPCFIAKQKESWPGIIPSTLKQFHKQLMGDPKRTCNNFLALQTLGSSSSKADLKQLRLAIDSSPEPKLKALDAGLELLQKCDLRSELSRLSLPYLRLYGRQDALVPKAVQTKLDQCLENSKSYLFTQSAHAPFISEKELFVQQLVEFYNNNVIK